MQLPVIHEWHCDKRGDCCQTGDLVMTQEEWALLAPLTSEAVIEPDVDPRFVHLKGRPCVFLGADGLCTVYAQRPYNCRRFVCFRAPDEPFLPGGPMGCLNLSVRVQQSREARRQYARIQRRAQRWGARHGWSV